MLSRQRDPPLVRTPADVATVKRGEVGLEELRHGAQQHALHHTVNLDREKEAKGQPPAGIQNRSNQLWIWIPAHEATGQRASSFHRF